MPKPVPPPTEEQWQVIEHPLGSHARVLAVAGSGKTSTMAYRARYLTQFQELNPSTIQVLMFNRLAADEFVDRLSGVELPGRLHPKVNTFHSFCFSMISKMERAGMLPKSQLIHGEQVTVLTRKAIRQTFGGDPSTHPEGAIEPEEAISAIGLWKGSLIRPENAGYHGHSLMPNVYQTFERLRIHERQITYDDFVPMTVDFLSSGEGEQQRENLGVQFLIVDEYQDVNYGQQRLLEILAGDRADIMVVGDDDQTIYEWRGARSSYIIKEFQQAFSNKPHATYKLSTTFRFGPVLAQAAHNAIAFNTSRVDKPLASHNHDALTRVTLHLDRGNSDTDVDHTLTDELAALLESGVAPTAIAVLCRMYTQLHGMEAQLMARKIPYHVLGASPFLERREIRRMLSYLRLATSFDSPLTKQTQEYLKDVVNFPNRMISNSVIDRCGSQVMTYGGTAASAIVLAEEEPAFGLNYGQIQRLAVLRQTLEEASFRADDRDTGQAGKLLAWLDEKLGLRKHFEDYYGKGEGSKERQDTISNLITYARQSGLSAREFLIFVDNFDPTWGQPESKQIRLTSIFKTKGLEYDYVFIPRCEEGYMPCVAGNDVRVFDKSGRVREPEPAEAIENERRLFYVGITRARNAVMIGASATPIRGILEKTTRASRFIEELQLASVTDLLGPLSEIRKGNATSAVRLVEHVQEWGGTGWVKQTFVETYLAAANNEDLTGAVATLISRATEKPFAYEYSYPTTVRRPSHQNTEVGKNPVWKSGRPDFGQPKPWGETGVPF